MILGIICFNKFELIQSTSLLVLAFNDDVILRTSSLVHGVKNSESGGESDDKIYSSTVVSVGGILLANDGPILVKKSLNL